MGAVWLDLRYGLRALRRNAGFTVVAVLTLALGIGANVAIFQLIDAMLLRTLPVRDPASLASVHLNTNNSWAGSYSGSYSEFTFPLWQQIEKRQMKVKYEKSNPIRRVRHGATCALASAAAKNRAGNSVVEI